ncbi:hypothetical protein BJ165DRAFT_1343662 [Panaeolus papilionaceus]|nr:hypothetical protein BJ165DRAFT_1343662 [Panaeolus papilionaceus]
MRNGEPSQFPRLDGNVDPLRSALQQQQTRVLSKENQEWMASENEGVVEADEEGGDTSFAPGTFVEVIKNESVRQGVVVCEAIANKRWRVYTLGSNGETFDHARSDVYFSIPNYISADLAERCGGQFLHESEKQLEARVAALKQLQHIVTESEKASYGAKNVERHRHINIYNHCKSPDPNKWGKVSIEEITKLVYVQPTVMDYFGIHKYMMRLSLRYVASPDYHKTQTFYVRPENDVNEIQLVKDWIAKHRASKGASGPYAPFITKARDILATSKMPFQGGDQEKGPVIQEPAPYNFNESDKVFISFLLRSMQPSVSNQTFPYTASRSQILKDLLAKEKGVEYTDATVHEVLIRLGVIPAWKDITELLPDVNNGYNFEMAPFIRQKNDNIVSRGIKSTPTAGKVLGPEDFHPADPLESVRHDFGNMPVYVIDDVSAEELDDGVSIEKITGEPENRWVHVHIADPASVIPRGHTLSRLAQEQASSLYLIQQSFPLFPKLLMHDPVYGMSLGDGVKHGRPDKCITFSAKIDGQGNILDYKIAAGLLRNIKKISYVAVDKALGVDTPKPATPFGHSAEIVYGPLAEAADVEPLKDIYRIAKLLERKRYESGFIQPSIPGVELKSSIIPPTVSSVSVSGSKYSGFPDLLYHVTDMQETDTGAHSLVAEMMKLGCMVASMVARDNNLPIIRRGADPIIFASEEARQRVYASRTSQGYIPMLTNLNSITMLSLSKCSTALMAHASLGASKEVGYSRVTSPLRRFQDLVCHWQLHHLLLGAKAPARAPWSFSELEELIRESLIRERVAMTLHKQNTNSFAFMFIKRWLAETKLGVERPFEDPMADLTGYLRHEVRRDIVNGNFGTMVYIPKLGIPMKLVDLGLEHEALPASTMVRVKVKRVDLGIQRPAIEATLKEVIS